MIKTETVVLREKTKNGVDAFGADVYTINDVYINDVIVGTPTFEAQATDLNLNGKRLAFVLGIPKGDNHEWKDTTVLIRGEEYRTYGFPMTQTEQNVPLRWNMQVKVERYE